MGAKLSKILNVNVARLNDILNLDTNFDIIRKGITIAGRDACIYFIDGFLEEAIMEKLLEFFYKLKPEELPLTAQQMAERVVPYVEVSVLQEEDSILKNLISNALKYTPEGGSVHIYTAETEDYWSVEVKDTGIGIPSSEQKKLFKIHFRG